MQECTRGECVYRQEISSGHIQKVFVMYHGTSPGNASYILREGFKPSRVSSTVHGMLLGQGVYVSRDKRKAMMYGKVVLKLLVYTGKTCHILTNNLKVRSTWHHSFDSAWIPPLCRNPLAPAGFEETCVKDPKNILVLGVVMGKQLLIKALKLLKEGGFSVLKVLTNFSLLSALVKFTENLKLGYFYLRNTSSGKILSVETKSRGCKLVESVSKFSCTCYALWCWLEDSTFSTDDECKSRNRTGSLCNKLSGRVLTIKSEQEGMWLGKVTCNMADYGINFPIWTQKTNECQVLTVGPSGELLHLASGQFVTITRDMNNNQGWVGLGYDRDYWETVYSGLCPVCDVQEGGQGQ